MAAYNDGQRLELGPLPRTNIINSVNCFCLKIKIHGILLSFVLSAVFLD